MEAFFNQLMMNTDDNNKHFRKSLYVCLPEWPPFDHESFTQLLKYVVYTCQGEAADLNKGNQRDFTFYAIPVCDHS